MQREEEERKGRAERACVKVAKQAGASRAVLELWTTRPTAQIEQRQSAIFRGEMAGAHLSSLCRAQTASVTRPSLLTPLRYPSVTVPSSRESVDACETASKLESDDGEDARTWRNVTARGS